ncbi:sirohydrochlorin chelatase [Actinoalloteichus sp. AHMU CJ021]|uniref:sirohydrochlorin chelatase n=1 Tax=Actinoalloteichus sp. AHMU CJ021 TaxID=2072503 RepID=UPI000CA0338B|nr:sirohydrochlorin chelatase [Actinoalloteichus sp. AHMU CJ021]
MLLAVAHGSRDPRSAATISTLMDVVRTLRPDLEVRLSFLELSAPRFGEVLSRVDGPVTVVPLLLSHAYHAGVDVPGSIEAVRRGRPEVDVRVAEVLGPDPVLESSVLRRLAEAEVGPREPDTGVVLAAAGSAHEPANALVRGIASRWAASGGWAGVEPAFAAAADPAVDVAVERLRAAGARRIAVAPWFLAPGLLLTRVVDRVRDLAPDATIAAPIGADIELAQLVLRRFHAAECAPPRRRYA